VDPVINTFYSVPSTPTLVVNTSNIFKEGTINFTLTVFSRSTLTDAVFKTYNFSVNLIDNPCVEGFTGLPPSNSYEVNYTC